MRLWVEHFYLRDNELSRKDWEAMASLDDVRRAIGHGLLLQLVGAMLLIGFLGWLSSRVTGRPRLCIVSRRQPEPFDARHAAALSAGG